MWGLIWELPGLHQTLLEGLPSTTHDPHHNKFLLFLTFNPTMPLHASLAVFNSPQVSKGGNQP